MVERVVQSVENGEWTPKDDILLISSWLNTSKDPVVSNEQRSDAFWTRIAAYFAASRQDGGCEQREARHCKQRWHMINDLVCKFCGAYEAASREKTSGQNENDVLKQAHQIFYTNHKKKFLLEHAWKELSSQATKMKHPPGIKAAKASGKKTMAEENAMKEFHTMWSIKQQDLAMKDRLSKMRLLESLIAKKDPLAESRLRVDVVRPCEMRPCHLRLWNDYFSDTPTYPENLFRRRFRMNKPLFMCIVDHFSNEVQFFRQKQDVTGRLGLSALQKCSTAIRVLAYGSALDAVDEYLRLGATTARLCVENFVEVIINLFGDEYLRRPTLADLQRLLHIGELRGFPGMIGSNDCMHWEWKNRLTAWKGQYSRGTLNDINVLDRSPVFNDIINGRARQVNFSVNGREYHLAYYLTDGPKAVFFAQHQEAVRKDVERAFGVLQARFAIVKNPALSWDKVKIGKIMRACIILHNMIVEDERDEYTQYDISDFQQGEGSGSSHVDPTYSTKIPTNIANQMGVRTRIHDRQAHQQLKGDLVEHI
uniref:Myb-like domain-containing protein n=1 Tax=Brassica oleracea var. oleracea TaxID=109376 RepID=A0A0D3BIL9_BRAOL